MTNRVTLDQFEKMPIGEIAKLPVEQLAMLQDDVDALAARAKRVGEWLHGALTIRYDEAAKTKRLQSGKDIGIIHLKDEDFDVSIDTPKRVKWNEDGLEAVAAQLRSAGEDPNGYIDFSLSVSERSYGAWPPSLKAMFEPHRTVEIGKPKIRLERKKAA